MSRVLEYPARRMVRLTAEADRELVKMAAYKGLPPASLARQYVEDGLRRDMLKQAKS